MDSKTKIRDVVTGQVLAVRPAVLEARIQKAGSRDKLLNNYVGRDTKRMLREGMTVEQIRAKLGVDDTDLPAADELGDMVKAVTAVKNRPVSTKKAKKNNDDEETEPVIEADDEDVNKMLK